MYINKFALYLCISGVYTRNIHCVFVGVTIIVTSRFMTTQNTRVYWKGRQVSFETFGATFATR